LIPQPETEQIGNHFYPKLGGYLMHSIVRLQDESELMTELMEDTFQQIKNTTSIVPVKVLIEIYDMLHMIASILDKFEDRESVDFDTMWVDMVNLKLLNKLRCELVVYHRGEFESFTSLDSYIRNFQKFIFLVELRLKNKALEDNKII
jgi:hypothetical protein